jgi:gamma-glutamyltranspeptidase/glutathione hydrolase
MRDFELPGRSPVYATHGMAATSHPRATLAGVEVLRAGGNAIDAAVAAAGVLAVVEPHMTGIGGDCFALYAPPRGGVIAYNGSGRAPAAAEPEWFLDRRLYEIPEDSAHAVTVPGAVEAWARLVADHGTMELGRLLAPAIELAEAGYPVAPRVARDWTQSAGALSRTAAAGRILLPGGRTPRTGDVHRQPELAATLRRIAADGAVAFYSGEIAEDMVATLGREGGLHTAEDFATHAGDYVEPIRSAYRGFDVYECPPNGQGFTALLMLNVLEGFDLGGRPPLDAARLHLQCEAGRLAYRDRDAVLGDPRASGAAVAALLEKGYAEGLRRAIRPDRAMGALPAPSGTGGDTVYLSVVDRDGGAASFINSLYYSFGSGIMSERTGVMLHNRGGLFTLAEGHPNRIAPRKRPMHTLMPGMLAKDGRAVMPFGVMGGHYQPFGHVQVVVNMLDFELDVQEAIDLPRFFHTGDALVVERGVPRATVEALGRLGHRVHAAGAPLGGGQAVWIDRERGVLIGGSDPRKDGCAVGF